MPRRFSVVWRYAVLITLALWSAPSVLGGQADDSDVRRQVLATDDRRMEALRSGDAEPLRQIYADDYTLVTPAGVIRSKVDQIDELASGKLRQKIRCAVGDVRVSVPGDGRAAVPPGCVHGSGPARIEAIADGPHGRARAM